MRCYARRCLLYAVVIVVDEKVLAARRGVVVVVLFAWHPLLAWAPCTGKEQLHSHLGGLDLGGDCRAGLAQQLG